MDAYAVTFGNHTLRRSVRVVGRLGVNLSHN